MISILPNESFSNKAFSRFYLKLRVDYFEVVETVDGITEGFVILFLDQEVIGGIIRGFKVELWT